MSEYTKTTEWLSSVVCDLYLAQLVKNPPVTRETWVQSWVGKIPWRRQRLPTPVLWPGEFHGLYSPWDRKESDTIEQLSLSLISQAVSFFKDELFSY